MIPTEWDPTAAVAPLPSLCLGTDKLINGSLHDSFPAMWTSLVPGSRTLSGSMYLTCATSDESGLRKCLQLSFSTPKKRAPDNPSPQFTPAHSCLINKLVPNQRFFCVTPPFQAIFSGTRNKSTTLYFLCRMRLWCGIYTHFEVVVRIELWKAYIIFVGLQHR